MFSQENGSGKTMATKISNNAEGTVLLQLILQTFEGTQALHATIFEQALNMAVERLK